MPPPRQSKLEEYQRFQAGQAAQQAQMMQMLTQMYGINRDQQLLTGQLEGNQYDLDAKRIANEMSGRTSANQPTEQEQKNRLGEAGIRQTDAQTNQLGANTRQLEAQYPWINEQLRLENERGHLQNSTGRYNLENTMPAELAQRNAQTRSVDMNTAGNAMGFGLANIEQGRGLAGQNNPAYVQSIQDKVREAELVREQGRAVEDARNAVPQPPLPPATNNEALQRVFQQGRFDPYANETVGQELGRKTGDVLGAITRTIASPFVAGPRAIGHALRQKKNDKVKSGSIPFIPPKGNFWDY